MKMTTLEKANSIRQMDFDILGKGKSILGNWEDLVSNIYDSAKGNEAGWLGIAEKDPQVIEKFYPEALKQYNKIIGDDDK